MAKKKNKRSQGSTPKGWLISPQQVEQWLALAVDQLIRQDFAGVVQTCQRVLRYAPPGSQARGEALEHLGTAYSMLKQFEAAYQALSQALEINPHLSYLWYNRALNGRFTIRTVQAVRDLEKAVELETAPQLREKWTDLLAQTREIVESERALRGPNFTLDQLEEQQGLFQQGLQLMQAGQWVRAEQAFRRIIELGDCLPQPQGNLGLALLMQRKYDEAEAAWRRALAIDPDYDLAQFNLAGLPEIRRTGRLPEFVIRDPLAGAKVNLTVQWQDEE